MNYYILGGRHGGAMLCSRVSDLFTTSGGHDGPPTQGMLEVADAIGQQLAAQEAALAGLMSEDLARLNELAKEADVPYVVTP